MLSTNFFRLPIVVLALSITQLLHAQEFTPAEKTAAIQTIARHIASNYVYPDQGGQIASHIQMANHRGDFSKAATWKEFDSLVTRSLQKFSRDNHLYVRFDPAIVKQLKSSSGDTEPQGSITVEANEKDRNYGFSETKVLPGNVGYIKLTSINISEKSLPVVYEAMRKVQNTDALIIDLRDNGGGGSQIGPVLESFFLPENTLTLEFVSRKGVVNTESTVNWLKEKKYGNPLYIIVNKNTASAAEALAFVLQQNKRAKIVGERSAGAAYMNEWFVVDDNNYVSVSTAAPQLPGKEITWERTGVQPNIKVKNGDPVQEIMKVVSRK
jgi:hypothetical protein